MRPDWCPFQHLAARTPRVVDLGVKQHTHSQACDLHRNPTLTRSLSRSGGPTEQPWAGDLTLSAVPASGSSGPVCRNLLPSGPMDLGQARDQVPGPSPSTSWHL